MRKQYTVSWGWYVTFMALVTALCASALTLALLRWPVVGGFALAGIVSALMLWGIVQVVTSGAQPMPTPDHRAAATVDGVPVKEVEVMS